MKVLNLKRVVVAITTTAIIIGGLVVGFSVPEPMTWDEFNALMVVRHYEVEQSGGTIVFSNDNGKDFWENFDNEILKRVVLEETITLGEENLTNEEYLILRNGLVEKYKRTSIIKRILD